jgi:phage shock protein B
VEDAIIPVAAFGSLFIALPWIILHYMSQWRRAKGISIEDENLLDDLHDTARRLDARLDSIERIIAADNPDWKAGTLGSAPTDRVTSSLAEQGASRLAARR